jgi:Rps23 Pro-64 3,4-dihydroxylase Tpa1-like proline 4-hydroxylase
MINLQNLSRAFKTFHTAEPFNHCVVDNILHEDVARALEAEFLDFNSPEWFVYENAIEVKKQNKDWGLFPKQTYQLFYYLNSPEFVKILGKLVGVPLYADPGLHGGGWHMHGTGGVLNPHLDYSLHPKLGLQRKINIIIYLSSDLKEEHGGHLGLYTGNEKQSDQLVKEVAPVFNRAVLFDTTQNSWHGMSRQLTQPDGIYRKSFAVYYLTDPPAEVDTRSRALFSPTEEQRGNKEIIDFIQARAK